MGRDNAPRERQRRDLERKRAERASYDRILIVSEGSKTEPNYFKEIRNAYRLHATNVVVCPSNLGTTPMQVVRCAEELFRNGDPQKNIGRCAFEKIYAVFDRDDHESYFEALKYAASLNGKLRNDNKTKVSFNAITSVPCFELWLLLHYEDVHAPLHRDEVTRRLKKYIPRYEKGLDNIFSITFKNLATAIKRADTLTSKSDACDGVKPYTDITELVSLLIAMGSKPSTNAKE